MGSIRALDRTEIEAVLKYIRREPPGMAIANAASQATWWEVQLAGPKELGALQTLWTKERAAGLTDPGDAMEPTVAQVAARIRSRTFKRPGLQAKVTRYANRMRGGHMEIMFVLEQQPWGTFIQEGTTRAVALYLLHLQQERVSRFFPLRVVAFEL